MLPGRLWILGFCVKPLTLYIGTKVDFLRVNGAEEK